MKTVNIIDKFIEISLYVLVFFIPFSKAGIEIFFGFALLGFLIKKAIQPDFRFLKSSENLILLFFILFTTLSLFNSGIYFIKSFRTLIGKWIEYVLIFLIFKDTFRDRKKIGNIITILIFVALIIGFDGIYQRLSGKDFIKGKLLVKVTELKDALWGVSASFNHYNDFGIYLVMILSVIICYKLLSQQKYRSNFIFLVESIFLTVCLLLTFSRGAWLGFLSTLLWITVLSKREKKLLVMIIAIFIILILIGPSSRERLVFTFKEHGDTDRVIMWQSAFRMIRENPFLGKGVGTFMDYFHKYVPYLHVQYAHNCYLQMWAEAGIFTLLSFLLFIGIVLCNSVKAFLVKQDYLILGLIAAIIGFLVHSFFDTHFYSLQLSSLFWVFLGLLANFKQENNPQ